VTGCDTGWNTPQDEPEIFRCPIYDAFTAPKMKSRFADIGGVSIHGCESAPAGPCLRVTSQGIQAVSTRARIVRLCAYRRV
jgi:hypothetical protein